METGGSGGVVAGGPLRGNNLSGVVAGAAGAGQRLGAGTPQEIGRAKFRRPRRGGTGSKPPVAHACPGGRTARGRAAGPWGGPPRDAGSLSPVRPLPCGLVAGRGRGKFRPRPVPGSVIGDRATET